jgi:hypothetical protein
LIPNQTKKATKKFSAVQIVGSIIIFTLFLLGVTYIEFFYSTLILNEKGLTALIEAETTLLGFFGLIIAYLLTSLDSKRDKLEELRIELIKENPNSNQFRNNLNPYRDQKRQVIKYSIGIGALLTLALFLSIGILGVVTATLTIEEPLLSQLKTAGTLTVTFIALSVILLFRIFYNIGKE